MIRVENKRMYCGEGGYIGRPGLLVNPFEIGIHREREDVIRFYRQRLWDQIVGVPLVGRRAFEKKV